jgi:hypothetical protein
VQIYCLLKISAGHQTLRWSLCTCTEQAEQNVHGQLKWTQIAVALTVHQISDFAATLKEFGPVRSATDCFLIYHLASEIDKFVLFSQHNTIELFSFVPLSAHLDKQTMSTRQTNW